MKGNEGYIRIVAAMQKYFDQAISGNWSYNPHHYENHEVPLSVMLRDLLTSYKLGWKTSYYQNTYDMKSDDGQEALQKVEQPVQLESTTDDAEVCDACAI
jgi:ribonucleoside-diphosphate reductase alpha chain